MLDEHLSRTSGFRECCISSEGKAEKEALRIHLNPSMKAMNLSMAQLKLAATVRMANADPKHVSMFQ